MIPWRMGRAQVHRDGKKRIPDRGKLWASNLEPGLVRHFKAAASRWCWVYLQISDYISRWLESLPGPALSASSCLLDGSVMLATASAVAVSCISCFLSCVKNSTPMPGFKKQDLIPWASILVSASLKKPNIRPILLWLKTQQILALAPLTTSCVHFCFASFCVCV